MPSNPDEMEIAPGTVHEKLEGTVPTLATEDEIRQALEKAFDYRGDVTITRKDGTTVEGYIFDRRTGCPHSPPVPFASFPRTRTKKSPSPTTRLPASFFPAATRRPAKAGRHGSKNIRRRKPRGKRILGLRPRNWTDGKHNCPSKAPHARTHHCRSQRQSRGTTGASCRLHGAPRASGLRDRSTGLHIQHPG